MDRLVAGEYSVGNRTIDDLRMMQALPLAVKVRMTETRIREWVNIYGENGVYISFSGGKDSTVLLHIVRGIYPNIPAVFVNTGLEYPEIQKFVRTFDNVTILRPKMRFDEVIKVFGYPFISKAVSGKVYLRRKYGEACGVSKYFDENYDSRYSVAKYKPLLDVDFNISKNCCDEMKKKPVHRYGKQTNRMPIIGMQASESFMRTSWWLKNGCNAFDSTNPTSNPMAFWTEQDVLKYILDENIQIASVYGSVVAGDIDEYEQQTFFPECKYRLTGCDRTGCIFCGFGAHFDKGEGRYRALKRTHPRQYDYCMGGGGYDTDGLWKPTKEGLGMAHCIDELNKIYGKDFIKY